MYASVTFSVCAHHVWTIIGFQTSQSHHRIILHVHVLNWNWDLKWAQRNISLLINEYENKLILYSEAQTWVKKQEEKHILGWMGTLMYYNLSHCNAIQIPSEYLKYIFINGQISWILMQKGHIWKLFSVQGFKQEIFFCSNSIKEREGGSWFCLEVLCCSCHLKKIFWDST